MHKTSVVRDLKQYLLGLPAIGELHLLAKVSEVMMQEPDDLGYFTAQIPALFSGLETLNGEFCICLKLDAAPFGLHTLRNVSLPLCKKVKEELALIESLGVISKIDIPCPCVLEWLSFPRRVGLSGFVYI